MAWKKIGYLREEGKDYEHQLILPEPLANWDVFDYWERQRTTSIIENMKKDDVLFDIGSETGWLSAIYAQYCKVFLIEPQKKYWPAIYKIWKKNVKHEPAGCYAGLASSITNDENFNFNWPKEIEGETYTNLSYEYINNHSINIPQIKIDDLVIKSGKIPQGITIDVEGAEFLVLKGCEETIKKYYPKIWVSFHPDLMKKGYNTKRNDIMDFMAKFKYKSLLLVKDHEEHWFFKPWPTS